MEELIEHLAEQAEAASTGTPLERALAATELYTWGREVLMPQVATLRRAAVRELRAEGHTLKEVAEMLGVTDARISQILAS